jgi:hypothetical protein
VSSAFAFASAALPWFELRPRPAFSADHRLFAAAVGIGLLILGIWVVAGRAPTWAFAVGAASCLALGGFAIYDMVTGHNRTFDALVTYIGQHIRLAEPEAPGIMARRLLATWQVWFYTGAGMYLALVAAAFGLAATFMAIRSLRPTSMSVASAMLLAALVILVPACSRQPDVQLQVLSFRTVSGVQCRGWEECFEVKVKIVGRSAGPATANCHTTE